MSETIWKDRAGGASISGAYTSTKNGLYLSYQPNSYRGEPSTLDSANPETAIVLINDKKNGTNRYLIYRGDRREELASLFPDREKLIEHWKQHGGHFWSDSLED